MNQPQQVTVADVVADTLRRERLQDIDSICEELSVCARNAAAQRDDGSARRIQNQIIRLRGLATSL